MGIKIDTPAEDSRFVEEPLLSVCVRCRDGREDRFNGRRGVTRFAEAILAHLEVGGEAAFHIRGVRCMSQRRRACAISLTAPGAFTWLFGDLDPRRHGSDVFVLTKLYAQSPCGLMTREMRPEPMRLGVLGRLPPIGSTHPIIEALVPPRGAEGRDELTALQL